MTEIKHKFTPCGDHIRATVWTDLGTSSKTCATMSEAQMFVNTVKAKRTWVRGRKV